MERIGRRTARAVPRAAVGRRRADRARVPLHEGRQRLLRTPRPDVAVAARPRPRGHWHLPCPHRLSGAGERERRRAAVRPRRSRGRRSRRHRCDRRAARHGRRSFPSVPQGARALGSRRPEPGKRRHRTAASDDPGTTGATRHRARGDRRRNGGAGRAPRDRARRIDSPRPRRRLAAERGGRLQRLLAHRPDPCRTRGGSRSERRRRRPRRRANRSDRHGRAVCRLRRRPAAAGRRGGGRARHAHDRPGRKRRQRRPWLREHRRPGRRGVGDHRCGRGRPARRADGPRVRPRGASCPVRGRPCHSGVRPPTP